MVRQSLKVAFGLLALLAIGFVEGQKPHDLLTDEEFYKVFRTTRENVPEYELVQIKHDLYKRQANNLRVQYSAFGQDYDIRLNPSDGILAGRNTPIWLASSGSNGRVNYKRMRPNILGEVTRTFVGRTSALVVDESNGDPRFEGTIDDTTIVSWPATVVEVTKEQFDKLKRDVSKQSRTLIPTGYHAIIKSKSLPNDDIAAMGKQVDKIVQRYNDTDHERRKRWAGSYVYPSILITVDYASTPKSQDERKYFDMIRYQLAFWNSVDLRYRELDNPKVRLRIAGIVISQDRAAVPYINKYMNGNKFDIYSALQNMQPYWSNVATTNKDFGSTTYNVIATMTDRETFDPKNAKEGPLGLANTGAFCRDRNNQKQDAVTIITDNGKYDGITTATHELGHILGAEHDLSQSGPCAEKLGYLMSPRKSLTLNVNRWSSCSLNRIKLVFGNARDCPAHPAEGNDPGPPIERTVPADYYSAQTQCEKYKFSWPCDPTPKTCKRLQCWLGGVYGLSTNWQCQDAPVGALDGTPCADNAVCVRGECRRGDTVIQ